MLVNMKELLKRVADMDKIVPGFNVFGYEDAKVVIDVATELGAPAILMSNKDAAGFMDVKYYGALYKAMAEDANTEVVIHLDHGKTKEEAARAIQAGYSSVMYDGSAHSIEENISVAKVLGDLCEACNVSLEVEVGCVAYSAEVNSNVKERLSEIDEVLAMAKEAKVDAIAVAVGNVHRMERQEAIIDYDRLEKIDKACDVPLVMHGSSGIKDEDIVKLCKYGLGKMNIGTTVRQAFGHTMRKTLNDNTKMFDRIEMMQEPMEAMRAKVMEKYKLLGW